MRLHKSGFCIAVYKTVLCRMGIKKRLRRQNAPKAQRQTKKNATSGRAIAPPRRVSLAINKNGFKRKSFRLSTEYGRIIALGRR